jgi:simple sugar transport system permease protein
LIWFTFLFSGGLAGLAGMMEVAGPIGQLLPVVSPGYGFTAIIVAFLGRLHPVGVLFAAVLIALSYIGGEQAQIELKQPKAVTGVFQGMLLFFLLGTDVLIRYRIRFARRHGATSAVRQDA